jgi:hypothetical protein
MHKFTGFTLKAFLRNFSNDGIFFIFRAIAGEKQFDVKLHVSTIRRYLGNLPITSAALLKFGQGTHIELLETISFEYISKGGEVKVFNSEPVKDLNEYIEGKKLSKFGGPVTIWTFDNRTIDIITPSDSFLALVDAYGIKQVEKSLETTQMRELNEHHRATQKAAKNANSMTPKPVANPSNQAEDDDFPF